MIAAVRRDFLGESRRWPLYLLWAAVVVALPIWASYDKPAWDVAVYRHAIEALRHGQDPYASAIAVQTATHLHGGVPAGVDPPWSYVYSPITLPLLRLIAALPGVVSGGLYWATYIVSVLLLAWVGLQAVEADERPVFRYLAAVAAFFPGLLANGIVLGGNIAYLLYAGVFLVALMAWRGHSWRWFYLAVVLASCVKAPLLCLVVLPIFTARKQWWPALGATLAGCALFGMQMVLWPQLFRNYLQAVALQFTFNRDFGCSPAGLLSGWLYDRGIAYTVPAAALYAAYAAAILATMFFLSRRFLRGSLTLRQWMPVLMVGVILLNPRLIEYDVAPLALPLALIGWRALRRAAGSSRAVWIATVVFGIANAMALSSWSLRKAMDGPLLVIFFAIGSYTLTKEVAQKAAALQGGVREHIQVAA